MARLHSFIALVGLSVAPVGACHSSTPAQLEVTVDDTLGARQSSQGFQSRFVNSFGEECGMELELSFESLPGGALRVVANGTNHFSYEYVSIELVRGPQQSPSATVKARGFFDGGAEHYSWKDPRGRIVLSSADWSSVSPEHPLYLKFDLFDSADPANSNANGFVRIPN